MRQHPHLPAEHLPAHWPAERAEQLFHALAGRFDEAARSAAEVLDRIDLG